MAAPALPATAGLPAATSGSLLAEVTLNANERSAARARAVVKAALGKASPVTSTVCLLVSELVTNAILHTRSGHPGGTVTIAMTGTNAGLRVEVTDNGSPDSVPVLRAKGIDTSGRGLLLVDALADAWGYSRMATSTTVWFRLRTIASDLDGGERPVVSFSIPGPSGSGPSGPGWQGSRIADSGAVGDV